MHVFFKLYFKFDRQPKTLGIKILSSYAWTATLPMISLVNHRQAEVFNYAGKLLKEDEVTSWLKDVLLGLIPPSSESFYNLLLRKLAFILVVNLILWLTGKLFGFQTEGVNLKSWWSYLALDIS